LNGTTLDGKRLLNKGLVEEMADGRIEPTVAGETFYQPYAPDFDRLPPDAPRARLRLCLLLYDDVHVGLPTHPHLTSFMFPITPVELHEGFIMGEERIVTNRSGLFGFGDRSRHEVHVFNDQGREVPDCKAPLVEKNGKTYTGLRLAEDWSAAIVRK